MKLKTRHFGEIEINEEDILVFDDGILGFEDSKKYIIINNPDPKVPFMWLQGVDEPELAFVITDPFLFVKDLEFDIPDRTVEELAAEKPQDIVVYSIAVVPEDIKEMTINLKGPIVINGINKKAKQIVLENDKYSLKHKIFSDLEKTG